MFKKYFSQFSLKHPFRVVYMLQASEYKIGDYLNWYFNAPDFSKVENRKKLVMTQKAKLLLGAVFFLLLCWFYFFVLQISGSNYLLAVFGLFFLPYVLSLGILLPLIFIQIFIQKPIEHWIIKKARKKISRHSGLKIAVAGSFGKTSMREILKTILSASRKVAAPPENHNTLLGMSRFIQSLTGEEEVLVFEFGEYYRGDIAEMCSFINPDIGVITGINEAHLHKFKKLEITTKTIFELADYLGKKTIYLNAENALVKNQARPTHLLYSREGIGDLRVVRAESDLFGTVFDLDIDGAIHHFHSNLLGLHQIGPLLVGIDLARNLGASMQDIIKGVSNTRPFPHRMELSENAGVITLDDSYNGNPDGVFAVISFLSGLKDKRRFYVTPGLVEMGSAKEEVHRNIGKWLAASGIEYVILIKNSATFFIALGLTSNGFAGEIVWFDDALSAFKALPNLTVAGDVVLLQNDWPDQYY